MHKNYEDLNLTDQEIADVLEMRDHFWKEDTAIRQLQLQKLRRLKFFWNNITNIWLDSVAHDWRVGNPDDVNGSSSDQAYYDQRINVFKAYLESIFAALSILVPPVKAVPDNAENSDDIETAKAADKISGIIYRHNSADMLWLHNLYIWGTEGLVCGYNYPKFDKKNGTYKVDEYKQEPEIHLIETCPLCGVGISDDIVTEKELKVIEQVKLQESELLAQTNQENPEMVDGETQATGIPIDDGMLPMGMEVCPNCQQPMTPNTEVKHEIIDVLQKTIDEIKGKIGLDSYGGLNCKVPLYARHQDQVLYLFKCYEDHYANAIELAPKLHEKIGKQYSGNSQSFDSYEQWARLNVEYRGEYPVNVVTIKDMWVKCAAYNILPEPRAKAWKKKYPDGIRACFIGDLFAFAKKEALDEHWTLEYNPMADYLSDDPLGSLLTSVQEITNDLISLHKQTLEHGVGLTIVDPAFIDLNAYSQTEVVPGAMIPSKTISGSKQLKDGIVELKTANFNDGSLQFSDQVQSLGQLASGAMPSLFGVMDSETASQDSMSKNQAQSRLGLKWKTKCNWWKQYMGKAITMYMALIQCQDDERDVQKGVDGNFINIVIKKAELSGKIGRFELEANENLPMSWSQRKDVLMQLLLSPNPQIASWLMLPENQPALRATIGIDNFNIPGADDVDKQWAEIQQLINSEPLITGDIVTPEMPSIEIDELFDTHPIQFEICRKWAVSEVGQYYKYNLPAQYQNVLLHAQQHLIAMGPVGQPEEQEGQSNSGEPKKLNNKDVPITGDTNVPAIQ